MKRNCIYIASMVFAIFISITAWGQGVYIQCLSVYENGDVELRWSVDDASDVVAYDIYTSTSLNGYYSLLATITDGTMQYVHNNADAKNNTRFYYVNKRTSTGNQNSIIWNTCNFYLVNNGVGVIELHFSDVNNLGNFMFYIYRSIENAPKQLLATVEQAGVYYDTLKLCEAFVAYNMEIETGTSCRSTTVTIGDVVRDKIAPVVTEIDSVSINPNTGRVNIGWQSSEDDDIYGYIVCLQENDIWKSIDTLKGKNNTFYEGKAKVQQGKINSYRLMVLDSCLNASAMSEMQQTMTLTGNVDICAASYAITWSEYENMFPSLGGYEIYVNKDEEGYRLVAAVSPIETAYTITGLVDSSFYKVYVRAVNEDGSVGASSEVIETRYLRGATPKELNLHYATIDENDNVSLELSIDNKAPFNSLVLFRRSSEEEDYTPIMSKSYTGDSLYYFIDKKARIGKRYYRYYVAIVNACGDTGLVSNTATTIYLMGSADENYANLLQWNEPKNFATGVCKYEVHRISSEVYDGVVAELASNADEITYKESVNHLDTTGNQFCYYITAISCETDEVEADTVYSNRVCLTQKEKLVVPNAFAPEGTFNTIFRPVTFFVDRGGYSFRIFNREGSCLFETTNPMAGWDGRYKGKLQPEGVYVYEIRYISSQGYDEQQSGIVVLIR